MTWDLTELSPGERVMVYEDPAAETKPEGVAVLKKRIGDELGVYERWAVEFEADPGTTYERSVRPMNREQVKQESCH